MTPVDPRITAGLSGGATGVDSGLKRTATKENLAAAGQQFESVFTAMMLKSMRQTKLAEPLFDSKASDTFRDMQDQKLVQQMARTTPLGIGKAMTDFLAKGMGAAAETSQPVANGAGAAPSEPIVNQPGAKPPA